MHWLKGHDNDLITKIAHAITSLSKFDGKINIEIPIYF